MPLKEKKNSFCGFEKLPWRWKRFNNLFASLVLNAAEGGKNVFGFRKKKNTLTVDYDPAEQKPVIRCSICTGEQTACLNNLRNGRLTEIMLINNSADLEAFQAACGVHEIERVY